MNAEIMQLVKIGLDEAEELWQMQVEAFADLYEKYQDKDTSPHTEKLDKIIMRLNQPFTYYYYIVVDGVKIGGIRVVNNHDENVPKRISPIFIMKEHRNKGYAQKAIALAEKLHGCHNWELDTILQEQGNCYLYEKMGYVRTGQTQKINDKMTLVFYKKD